MYVHDDHIYVYDKWCLRSLMEHEIKGQLFSVDGTQRAIGQQLDETD